MDLEKSFENEFVSNSDFADLSFSDAIANAKAAPTIQEKVNFVVQGAIGQASLVGNTNDLRTKCEPFYAALKSGSEMVGLNGQWYGLVTHDVAGWDHWCMITSMYNSGIIDANDGCRYYAAFSGN